VPRARIIDGNALAGTIESKVVAEVRELRRSGAYPHLVTIQVGHDPATERYTRNQRRRFERLGIRYTLLHLDAESDEESLLSHIRSFNDNPTVSGIMVTLPLPDGINTIRVQEAIRPEKDVEGVGPFNLGSLIYDRGRVGPCSALAVLEAIRSTGVPIAGARAVIVGHSDIVGKPVTLCLLHDLATTTTCHVATRDLAAETRQADILVVAVGKPRLLTGDMVKEGAVVIDVGINEVTETDAHGTCARLVGDVEFDSVAAKAGFITPVPGGIGPITVAMLARNTVLCAREHMG
jgi:methylenetetrahydrofolate dehydrogenase (NADP+)/methenyltetrahydrofolate cyclohydrolase